MTFIEEQIWDSSKEQCYRDLPLYLTLGDTWIKKRDFKVTPEEILHLTRPRRTDEIPRLVHLGACRDWAIENMENWMRIIPEGRDLLLYCAQEHNDTEFLEAVERFERPAKTARARKGK